MFMVLWSKISINWRYDCGLFFVISLLCNVSGKTYPRRFLFWYSMTQVSLTLVFTWHLWLIEGHCVHLLTWDLGTSSHYWLLTMVFCDLLELEWGVRTKFPSNLIHCGLELFMQIITFYRFYALDFFFKVVVSSKRCWLVSFRVWYFLIFRSTRCFSVRWKTKMKLLLFLNKKLLQNSNIAKQRRL